MTESGETSSPSPLWRATSTDLNDEKVREIQRIVTIYLESRGSITTHDLKQLVDISGEQARYFFKRMVTEGRYRRFGRTSNTTYVVADG